MNTPDAENPKVRSLSIVDENGKAIAYLGPNKEGDAVMHLYDQHGTIRVSAAVCADENGACPSIALHDAQGVIQVGNVLAPDKKPAVPRLLDNRYSKFE